MSKKDQNKSDEAAGEVPEVPAAGSEESQGSASSESSSAGAGESRLARLRKKKDMPGGLWLKCESCAQMIYRKELEGKGRVCPSSGFHFTLPGRARIEMIADEGSWEERFAELTSMDRLDFRDKITYGEKIAKTVARTGQNDALLCGTAKIDGRAIVLAVLDFSFLGGSMGEVVGEKVSLAIEMAQVEKLPLILFTSSGGARMHEGVLSLMQMAKTSSALASFNDAHGFSICVMTHPTTGGVTASFASVCDITLAEPGALIGFAGPRVIATTLKQELPPGFQRSEFLMDKGQVDAIVNRSEMRSVLTRLIDYSSGPRVEERATSTTAAQEAEPKTSADSEEATTSVSTDAEATATAEAGESKPKLANKKPASPKKRS